MLTAAGVFTVLVGVVTGSARPRRTWAQETTRTVAYVLVTQGLLCVAVVAAASSLG